MRSELSQGEVDAGLKFVRQPMISTLKSALEL
jgi:hypothetical protein